MSEELLPCPFCGARAHMLGGNNTPIVVQCDECDAKSTPCSTENLAIRHWNRRAPLSAHADAATLPLALFTNSLEEVTLEGGVIGYRATLGYETTRIVHNALRELAQALKERDEARADADRYAKGSASYFQSYQRADHFHKEAAKERDSLRAQLAAIRTRLSVAELAALRAKGSE